MAQREPMHGKPLLGATLAFGFAWFLAAAGVVLGIREGLPIDGVLGPIALAAFPAGLAVALSWIDLGILRLAGSERPARFRRRWRRMWLLTPPIAAALGAACGALYPIAP